MDITLGERISTLRRQKELTQENLAKELNVSAQAVSKWENDQTCPDISLLPELVRRGARGNLVEVEEPGGDRVLITVE